MTETREFLRIGEVAPDFCLPNKEEEEICLHDFLGKTLVLYFYPEDGTPQCTTEAVEFTKLLGKFQDLNAEVVGISPDNPLSHRKFARKLDLKIKLLSDEDLRVTKLYKAWGEIEFGGQEVKDVIRTTYLIGPEGKIQYVWPRVHPEGHAKEVKNKIEEIKK